MRVILLSGGSGKRLWPLSNDVRSKQFVKIFKDADGNDESMLQRVYRQIKSSDKDAGITIATGALQVPAIRNQLEDKVSLCIEPCRRDTFPAIALASSYLQDVLGIGRDECVVVCPVDPYVDDTYYEAVFSLQKLVLDGTANITLMGIEPTYPSDKYGYIIPKSKDSVSFVSEFKEKPTADIAKTYIEKGALWNAGVFAFKLGYMMDRAHALIDFESYDDLLAKYGEVTKISFDYAVLEKEESIQVLRYSGQWLDVGTWNTMADVMSSRTKGDVTLDATCDNVSAINELDIPVLVMGGKNMVIAMGSDGILIADKELSGSIKPYVEKIEGDVRYADKSWGTYKVIDVQPSAVIIKNTVKAGESMSYHSHELRDEIWTVLSGNGVATVDGKQISLSPSDTLKLARGAKHSVKAITPMVILETQLGENITVLDKKEW